MTKEDLEKEAYLYAKNSKDVQNFECGFDIAFKSYLASAEPREKRIEELEEKVSYLADNLRVAREDREDLQLEVARGLKEFVRDFPATAIRYMADEQYVEKLDKAKNIIKDYKIVVEGDHTTVCGVPEENRSIDVLKLNEQAEQFLSEASE